MSASKRVKVRMGYGRSSVSLEAPADRVAWSWPDDSGDSGQSPTAPLASPDSAFAELQRCGLPEAVAGRTVGLLLADGTRPWEPREWVPGLLETVSGAARVRAFLCTGTHDGGMPENRALAAGLGAWAALEGGVVVNDARDGTHVGLGTTKRGTPVEVDPRLLDCDVLLVLSEAKPHYFAGYSNPLKYVIPGMASLETARANHSWALEREASAGSHPWHPDAARRVNPVAEDMAEAFALVVGERPVFALTYVGRAGELAWAGGGRVQEATCRAIEVVDRTLAREVEPVDVLVLSCGGHPLDESLYTAQRALELTSEAVRDGGDVLFFAHCGNGLGPAGSRENFFEPLCASRIAGASPASGSRGNGGRGGYRLYGHKPVRFAQKLDRLRSLGLVSALDPRDVSRAGMTPVGNVVTAWEALLSRSGTARVGFLDHGASTWVRAH